MKELTTAVHLAVAKNWGPGLTIEEINIFEFLEFDTDELHALTDLGLIKKNFKYFEVAFDDGQMNYYSEAVIGGSDGAWFKLDQCDSYVNFYQMLPTDEWEAFYEMMLLHERDAIAGEDERFIRREKLPHPMDNMRSAVDPDEIPD